MWILSEIRRFLKETEGGKKFRERASLQYQKYKDTEQLSAAAPFPISEKNFIDWYTNYANQNSEESAAAAVEAYISNDQYTSVLSVWISGIEVANATCLGDGYSVFPHWEMPLTKDSMKFAKNDWDIGYPWPKAAISKNIHVEKKNRGDGTKFATELEHLLDISRLMNLLPGHLCVPVLQTNTPLDIPMQSLFGGGGLIFSRHPLYENFEPLEPGSVEALKRLLNHWEQRSGPTKRRLRRSMERLANAKHHQDIRDRFLDLAIALEILLLHDNTNHVQLSLSFRLHGALLLGGDLEQKKQNQKLLGNLYSHRSAVAHQGTLGKQNFKQEDENWETFIATYEDLATGIIRKIVEIGLPDWNSTRLSGGLD